MATHPAIASARPRAAADSRASSLDRWAVAQVARSIAPAPVRFVLWDGFALTTSAVDPIATITFKNRQTLWRWVWDAELYFGESYMTGDVTLHGDLVHLLEAVYAVTQPSRRRRWWLWQPANDSRAARHNVHHHYDLGNDFYRLWLDAEMVYTCAYFPEPHVTLEQAQLAKMDLVCRKLHLRPGDRVIEAGCGWGSFALFMARTYGVTVRAYNISPEQVAYARTRARAEGFDGRVQFIEDDYRNISGSCDVFVSVGMLEHVGLADYGTFGQVINRTLTPDGRGLLHFIGRDQPAPLNAWIRRRIFPGAYPPALREVCERILEPQGLSVFDVENLRLHYAKTLEHWRRRFAAASEQVVTMFDEPFVRAWELYLAGSQAAFTTGWMQLFQVLFTRGGSNAIPWTRASGLPQVHRDGLC